MESIFKWLTKEWSGERSRIYSSWFSRRLTVKDFSGIDAVLFCFLQYCFKLNVEPCRNYLTAYLKVDCKQDIKKYNIHLPNLESLNYEDASGIEQAYQEIQVAAVQAYDSYQEVDLTDHDFKVDMYEFLKEQKSRAISQIMLDSYPKLTDGSDITEVSMTVRNRLAEVDEEYDTSKISEIDFDDSSEEHNEFICMTNIPCIDDDIGGIFTRYIYTLNAQPGSGKTKFSCVHFAYQVMVKAKKDVIYYENEMSESEIRNILISYHITRVYGGKVKLPATNMNKYDSLSEEQKHIYQAAKIDLFESGKYGKLLFKEGCIVEDIEDECYNIVRNSENGVALLVIDYMGLCESKPSDSRWAKRKEQFEIITDAYVATRHIVRSCNIAALCLNQFNDKGIEAAYAAKTIRPGFVQGGHIVQRHTDYDLSMTFTEEQKQANVRELSVTKTRSTEGFSNVAFRVDLSCGIFTQINS